MLKKQKLFKDSINLYKFIRLMLGQDISNRQIARRWQMDEKNFHEFKEGKYPVPRLSKLGELAKVLGIDQAILCQVAEGIPAQRVYRLIKTNNHDSLMKLISKQLYKAHKSAAKHKQQYHDLFENANDAIFIADVKTGKVVDCNKQAEILLGRSKKEIIGMDRIYLHPLERKVYYHKHFHDHVKMGKITELKKQYVVKKDGTLVPVLISSRVLKIRGKKVIQGIFRDISKRRK